MPKPALTLALAFCLLAKAGPLVADTNSHSLAIRENASKSNRIELLWPSQIGWTYAVQQSTNLATKWQNAASGLQATPATNFWWIDPVPAGTRFFRLTQMLPGVSPTNLLVNGDFSAGAAPWRTTINAGAQASLGVVGGEMVASITNATNGSYVQLTQQGFALSNGQSYSIQFDARSLGLARTIQALVQSTNLTGRLTYFSYAVGIAPLKQTYRLTFLMTNSTDLFARLAFNLAADTNGVALDNMVLTSGLLITDRAQAYQTVQRMGLGNNFMAGNALSGWGAPADYALLNQYHFAHCRIGYDMHEKAGAAPDYTLPQTEVTLYQHLVDYCLGQGLIAIVDPVHTWANGSGYTDPADVPKLRRIWEQVASTFADYSPDDVIFEIMNEPNSGNNISNVIATGLSAIRSQPANQRRQVLVTGEGFPTRQGLIDVFATSFIPPRDPCLIGTFHYYDPRVFSNQGDMAGPLTNVTWGTTAEIAQLNADFDAVVLANYDWANRNNTEPLPILLGEFGVDNFAAVPDRKRWLALVRMAAEARGFAAAHWSMYGTSGSGKGMGPWTTSEKNNPALRRFDPEPAEALLTRYEAEEGTLSGGAVASALQPGFQGTGYVAYPSGTGENVFCEMNVYIPADGVFTVAVRYASTNVGSLKCVTFNDTGAPVQTNRLTFAATETASSWAVIKAPMSFVAGENARLRMIADQAPGPLLDYICHGSNQNQPLKIESKPASLRWGYS